MQERRERAREQERYERERERERLDREKEDNLIPDSKKGSSGRVSITTFLKLKKIRTIGIG